MTRIVDTDENVFQALGFDAEESAELKLRASIMMALRQWIKARELTQEQAAKQLNTTQSRISDLLNGKINNLGTKRLLAMAEAAELSIEVRITEVA